MGCIVSSHSKKPLPEPPIVVYSNDISNGSSSNGLIHSPVKPKPSLAKQKVVIALYAYEGRDEGDLSFEKGEKLIILDDREPDWCLAKRLIINESGYIPMNFVVSDIIETEEWFFSKVSRREAEKLLLFDDYPRGTFLVRNSEQGSGDYTLSIRNLDHIKHYKIREKPDGQFYITSRRSFEQLSELVAHYSQSSNGLCCRLIKPCPKSTRTAGPRTGDEIDRNDLMLKTDLETGNFDKVYYGLFRGHTEVAIKTLKPGTMSPSAFLQEAAIIRKCRHNRLVPLYGVCSIGQPLLIVTEFMVNGSLLDYLRSNIEGQSSTVIDLIDMAAQIASGMAYLERMKLVHRDLAARNVLVGENKVVKVAGFGLARIIEEDEYVDRVGTKFPIKWTAPESANKGKFTSKSDVWSFGILLYELITKGQIPYPGMHNREVLVLVERGYRMPKPSQHECPNSIYQIMLDCWDANPEKRPTFEHLYNYFDDFFVANEPIFGIIPYDELSSSILI